MLVIKTQRRLSCRVPGIALKASSLTELNRIRNAMLLQLQFVKFQHTAVVELSRLKAATHTSDTSSQPGFPTSSLVCVVAFTTV